MFNLKSENLNLNNIDTAAEIEKSSLDVPWSKSELLKVIDNTSAVYYVFYYNNTPCGIGGYYKVIDEMQINNIAVLKDYRGKGIGSIILNTLIQSGKDIKTVTLEVAENNTAAVALYRKHGFVRVGIRNNYYKNQNAILMTKTIN
ncbi:ribosomal protein S18-alanine N-acetyltransferase [Eubacteriales bacterium OttesenSCG-928-G02]|nr:ribosomal protein S18-alanine N-acetyltransferase [Eubacteriales bacterium OttesenSCG-928-G02]